jgi:hypothetical protein
MIEKTINKHNLGDSDSGADLKYWLGCSPEKRLEAVEILRRQYYGDTGRLQRTAKVIQRKKS